MNLLPPIASLILVLTFPISALAEQTAPTPIIVSTELKLGQTQLAGGLPADAMASFEAVLAVQPANTAARAGEIQAAIQQALSQRQSGAMDGALATLARAKNFVPDDPTLLMDFGIQADAMHIYRDAEAALEQAHKIAPDDPKILYGLAHVELDEQRMPEAEADLRAYLKMRPEDASAHYGLGHLLHMMVRDDAAKVELERSLALQPQQTESWYELGEIARSRHEDAKARSDYEKVLQRNPKHGGALTGMGVLSYRARNYPSAQLYLGHAVVDAPDYAPAHRFYAMLLIRQGHKLQADKEEELARTLTERQDKLRHGYTLQPSSRRTGSILSTVGK